MEKDYSRHVGYRVHKKVMLKIMLDGSLDRKNQPNPTCKEDKLGSRRTKILSTLLEEIDDDELLVTINVFNAPFKLTFKKTTKNLNKTFKVKLCFFF